MLPLLRHVMMEYGVLWRFYLIHAGALSMQIPNEIVQCFDELFSGIYKFPSDFTESISEFRNYHPFYMYIFLTLTLFDRVFVYLRERRVIIDYRHLPSSVILQLFIFIVIHVISI